VEEKSMFGNAVGQQMIFETLFYVRENRGIELTVDGSKKRLDRKEN
jgi:hypothetical protein